MIEQLLCHLIGDYWLQNDWMALNKKKKMWVALVHAIIYTLPFLLLTTNAIALAFICLTHAIIDGTGIVEMLNKIKNWHGLDTVSPKYDMAKVTGVSWPDFNPMKFGSGGDVTCWEVAPEPGGILGYSPCRPAWICWLLYIVQDNTLHLLCNWFALEYLSTVVI